MIAQQLTAPLDSAVRLMLLDVLSAAAADITRELAPGSVEVRLRGSEPEFVVTPVPAELAAPSRGDQFDGPDASGSQSAGRPGAADGGVARINLRLPDQLKSQVELAADREGVSINAWLVRAVAAAVDRGQSGPGPEPRGRRSGQRYTGWGR